MNHDHSAPRVDTVVANLQRSIATTGWAVVGVLPTQDEPGPFFGYTVGLTALELPELIVYGVPPHVGQYILNEVARRSRNAGAAFAPGTRLQEVIGGDLDVTTITASDTRDFTMVREIYRPAEVTAQQIVWPDFDGRFPWDDGFDTCTIDPRTQPLLGPPPTE